MMGQPPRLAFWFMQEEVTQMEEHLRDLNAMPHRTVIQDLTDKFNASTVCSGKIHVQYKQVARFPFPLPKILVRPISLLRSIHVGLWVGPVADLVPELEVLAAAVQDYQGRAASHHACYLYFSTIIKPLNVVRMWMLSGR